MWIHVELWLPGAGCGKSPCIGPFQGRLSLYYLCPHVSRVAFRAPRASVVGAEECSSWVQASLSNSQWWHEDHVSWQGWCKTWMSKLHFQSLISAWLSHWITDVWYSFFKNGGRVLVGYKEKKKQNRISKGKGKVITHQDFGSFLWPWVKASMAPIPRCLGVNNIENTVTYHISL